MGRSDKPRSTPPWRSTSFHLGPELERTLQRHLSSGLYASASEVVRAGLRALELEDARHEALLAAIEEGRAYGPPMAADADLDAAEPAQGDLHTASTALRGIAAVDRRRSSELEAEDANDLLARTAACQRVAGWLDARRGRRLAVLRVLTVPDMPERVRGSLARHEG